MKKNKIFHEMKTNKVIGSIDRDIDKNIEAFEALFKDCQDVVKRKFPIGENKEIWAYISYIDVMVDRRVIEESVLEQLIVQVRGVPKKLSSVTKDEFEFIKDGGIASADIKEIETLDDVCLSVLSGDTILMIDGYEKAIVIATRGWPNRGIQEPDTEPVVRGAKDGFTEVIRFNTVLIRRRIRDTKLKIKQLQIGTRSRTDIALVYLEDVAREEVIKSIEESIQSFTIDGVLETGTIEQLIKEDWHSPFPQSQITQRPDKAASAILEGRVLIVVDNTPFVLILPTTLNCFYQAAEDYYSNWMLVSFVRSLRYIAAFFALSLPGLYIALTCFHPEMIPTGLVYSIAAARQGVPFPTIIEVLIMELEFELLREAGVRLPTPIGSTIGIVGGLIIGQAAVSANLVSPIIVVVVAITAISSFSMPSFSLTGAYRIIKYFIIAMCGFLGLYGYWLSVLVILIHLVALKSYNIPYLMPYVSSEINGYNDVKDSLFRLPLFVYKKRPIFAKGNKVRLRVEENEEEINDNENKRS